MGTKSGRGSVSMSPIATSLPTEQSARTETTASLAKLDDGEKEGPEEQKASLADGLGTGSEAGPQE